MSSIAPCLRLTTVMAHISLLRLLSLTMSTLNTLLKGSWTTKTKSISISSAKNILGTGKVLVLSIILGSQNPFLLIALTTLTLFLSIGCKGQGSQLAQLALLLEKQPVNSRNGRMHNGDLLTCHCFAFLVHVGGHLQVQILGLLPC